jgi:hypothetical protein
MNAPYRITPDTSAEERDGLPGAHAYSATCNCDTCFETWLAMPEPTPEEREAMARAFSLALAPSGGGELLTDWPKIIFPDLERLSDAELLALSKVQRKHHREERRSGGGVS